MNHCNPPANNWNRHEKVGVNKEVLYLFTKQPRSRGAGLGRLSHNLLHAHHSTLGVRHHNSHGLFCVGDEGGGTLEVTRGIRSEVTGFGNLSLN